MLQELQPYLPLRQAVLEQLGLDLFTLSVFWEKFFAISLDLESEHSSCPWDAISNSGLRVEIKYSQSSGSHDCYPYPVFFWRGLQGHKQSYSKAQVDYYILIGYDASLPLSDESFTLLAFTHDEIGNRNRIAKTSNPKYRSKFDKYIKTLLQVNNEIVSLAPQP